MNGDNSIQSTGKVHYKLLTSPSNILVVEWTHLRINYSSGETGGTYCTMQALFYESGKIEYIYGQMNVSSTSSQSRTIFFAGSNVAGSVGEIRNITTTFDYVNTFTAIATTTLPASTLITNLNSSADGSRRVISFTPTTVPGVILTSPLNNAQNQVLQPTLTWARWITPTHYLLYVGTDNPPTNFINGSNIGTVTSYVLPSALSYNTTYNWKVVPIYGDSQEGTSDQKSFKTLEAPLTGTKTIHPTTGDYTSFTAAFAALNVSGVGTGGVTFNVAPGLTFTESNLNLTATGTADNPIIFQKNGEGANPIIYAGVGTGSTDYIVRFSGTDYLTWDGISLYENSANTTTTAQMEYALWVANAAATNGAQNNIFRNFKIVLNRTNTSTRAIQQTTPTTPTNQTTGNNNTNEYNNITIENTYVGMWFAGNSTTYFDSGTIVRYCTIGADAANDIGNGSSLTRGLYMTAQQNVLIRNNVIRNISGTSTLYGMDLSSMVGSNNRIFNNKVYNITNTSTSSTSVMYGISLSAFTTGTQDFRVYNNMLWNLNHGFTGTATTSYYVYGIYVASGGGTNTYNIDFNSIRLSSPTNASNACVYFLSNAGINKLRNNILANFTSGHATPYHLGIFSASATALGATGSVSNNNVIHIANSTGGYAVRGVSTNYATIAAWTTASSQDNNSRPGNPQFDDANYLYVRTDTPTPVESKGAYLGIDWITIDIDGQSRHASTPDIGADEGTFQLEVIAETPTAQPTSLVTVPYSTSINGSFTAASPVAEKYLVVRSEAAHNTTPVDGTAYAPGGTLGNGTIVQASNGLTFSVTGLTAATAYVFTIYSYNDTGIGAPKYLTTSPLTGTRTTLPTAPANPGSFAATVNNWAQINLAATANASTDPIMVAWNTTSTFGTPAPNVDYSSNPAITGGGTVMYIGAASGLPNHTGLNELTTYYYRAWSYLTSDEFKVYSAGSSSSATTTMAPLTAPHTQDFNTTTPAFPPAGWTRWSGQIANPTTLASSTTWIQDDWLNVSGTNKAARMNIWSTSMFHWFVSPRFDLPAGDYKLKFDMCLTDYGNAAAPDMNGDDDKFIVLVSDDLATWTPTNIVREWNNTGSAYVYNNIPYTGTSVLIPLTGISGTKYFAFYGESTASNADNDFMVDNFQIAVLETYPLAPSVPSPVLAATNVSPITNLSWANDGTVTKIDVYFSADSTLVDNMDSSVRVVTNQTSPLTSYDLPILNFGTRYFWKVVAKNDIDETATSPRWSFTTMADPTLALPYNQNFGTTSTMPTGISTNFTITTTASYGNPASAVYKNITSPTTVGYIGFPLVGPLSSISVLEFDYKYTTSPSTPTAYALTSADQTKILVSTNYGETYTQYAAINSTNHTTTSGWTRKRVILTNLGATAGDKIIVRLENTFETGVSASHYFQLDNVTIFSPANEPVYSLTPNAKAFGAVDVGDFREQLFTITNNGAIPFTLTDIQVSDTDNFSLVDVPAPLPTLAYGETTTFKVKYAPIAGGTHTATLTIIDDISSRVTHVYADSLTGTGVALVVLPYLENLDGTPSVTISPASTWVVGTPAKTQINHAYSTPNAIVTRSLTANANISENSYVSLPTMSLSGITNGVFVGFYQNYYHEADYDGGELQYSTDFGVTWKKVNPVIGTGANFSNTLSYNWYNNASASGPITAPKWSGRSNTNPGHIDGWIPTYTWIPADSLVDATNLKLRFHFGTDGVTSYEGWALDDISVAAMPEQEFAISNLNITPVEYVTTNDTLSIKVNVANLGFGTDGTDLSLKINDTIVDVISTGTMQFNQTEEFEFNFTFSTGGTYTISVVLDDDAYTFNNTVSTSNFVVFNAGWLAEGFEVGFLPSRWVKWGVPYWEHSLNNAYDGTKAAKVTLAADSPGSMLATPRLTVVTGDSLFFWAKSSVAGMQLQLRHNSNADTTATWTAIADTITLSTSYVRYAVDLSTLDGEFERFAFEALPNGNAGTIYLDRVLGPEIYIPTAPPGPVVMTSPADRAVDVNPKTVVLDWDVPTSGGDPESYIVYIGLYSDPAILIDTYENYKEVFHPVTQYQPYTSDPSFVMEYGTDYYWMIVPVNSNGSPDLIDIVAYELTTQPAPLSGVWTIDPNGSGETNFTSFTNAVNYLNAYGVETGGVTINVAYATYNEAIPAITYNATDENPVYFVGIEGDNARTMEPPTIMGVTGTGTADAILKLNGCDWISFDNFIIKDNPANTDGTTRNEFGVLITNNGATNGAKNNTISNCIIQLNNTYNLTRGVKQIATGVTVATGSNSYNHFYNNTVTSYWGYELVGSSTAVAYDMGTEIGSATEGNGSILNCIQGVNYSYQIGLKIFQQNIVFIGGAAPAIQYGIYSFAGAANTVEIYENDISHASQMTASFNVYAIYITNNAAASIHDNNIHGLSTSYTSGYIYGIYVSQGAVKQLNSIYNNSIYDITVGYYFYGVYVTAAATNLVNEVYNNSVYNIFRNGTAAMYVYGFYIGSSTSTNNNSVYDNTVRDISMTASSYIYGFYLNYGAGQFYQNEVNNITAGTTFYGIYSNYANATPWYIRNNMVQNITTATFYGIYANYGSYPRNVYENEVQTITATSTAYGAYLYYGTGANSNNFYKNRIHGISSNGGTIYGINAYAYNSSLPVSHNVYKNFVYDLNYTGTSTSVVYGIYTYGYSSYSTVNVYNNFIYDLKAPTGTASATAPQIVGIYTSSAYAINLWNNTVYLNATSSNANFASAALYMVSGGGTAGLLDLKNNIFVNKSTPGATGRAVAFWKGSTVFTNMSATSNKNIYYAGAPSATNPIYYDGTNTKVTFDDYKAFIATKDQLSASENVPFVGNARTIDLHIDPAIPTYVEGNAIVVATVTDDIDGDVRNATTPDIGADEGTFTQLPPVETPLNQPTNLAITPASTSLSGSFTTSDATNYLVVRHTVDALGHTPIELKKYAAGDTLGANGVVVGNVASGAFTSTGLTNGTLYYFTIFANNQNAAFGPMYLVSDPLTGSKSTLPAAPNAPSAFTATAGGSYQIDLTATANANSNPIMVAWNTTNVFGTPLSNVTYSQGTSITGGGTVWYIGAAGSLPNHTGLNPATTYYYRAWSYTTSDEFYVFSTGVLDRNATTYATPVSTYPFTEGFESGFTNASAIGAPYSQAFVTGTKSWTANSTLTTYNRTPRTGSFNATLAWSAETWMFRPFQLTGGVEYQYKMYARQDYADPTMAYLQVAYGTAPTAVAMTNDIVPEVSVLNGDYQLFQGTFTPSTTGTYMIGIKGKLPVSTNWYLSIDDISLRPTPTVPETPTSLSPAMAAVNRPISVDLSWNNEGIVTKVDVYFSTDSLAVYNLDSSVRVATNQTTPLNSYDLPTLEYSTRYFWQIVCKNNAEEQAVSGLYYFNTMADPSLPVPYAENFGTLTALPTGWSMDASTYAGVSETHGRTGSAVYTNLYSAIPTFNITMPLIGPLPNHAMLKFDYRIVDYTAYPATGTTLAVGDSVNVLVSTNAGSTFTRRGSINSTNHTTSNGWATFQVPLVGNGAVIGDRVVIRYNAKWAAGDWYLDIDNVEVTTPPNEQLYSIAPGAYNFGEVQITSSATQQFTISNGGTLPFNVTNVFVSGGDASEFAVTANNLPVSVGFSPPYNFNVTFTPTTTGLKTTTLNVVDDITGRVSRQYTLTATALEEFFGTPINLQTVVTDYNNVALSWTPALTTPYVTWSGDAIGNSFRVTSLLPFDTASKFTTTDLAGYRGLKISNVKFFAANEDSATFRVRIWTGVDGNLDPTTMVRDIAVPTYTPNAWNEVTLETPLTITGNEALWIGYNVEYTPTSYPAALDSRTMVASKGCLISSGGGAWAASTLGANLMVKAYTRYLPDAREGGSDELMIPVINTATSRNNLVEVETRNAQTRLIQGYNVYRNGTQINPTLLTGTTYNDLSVPNGNYDYYVKATYVYGTSNPSNTVSLTINRPVAYALPFAEDWSSNSLSTNYWTKVAANWALGSPGNPAPSLKFNYNPIAYNYNHYVTSWDIDALAYNDVNLKYDIRLDTNTTESVERFAVEVYDGDTWQEVENFTNQAGDFAWDSRIVNISSIVGNSIFKVRFRAYGSDSSTLNYWSIDNILIEGISAVDAPAISSAVVNQDGQIEITWSEVDGASSYKVYGSSSTDDSEFPIGWTELTNPNPTATTFVYDPSADNFLFFKVTAVSGARGNETVIPMTIPARSKLINRAKK
jgi:hypothetical protein